MIRYLLFAGQDYYPDGGGGDFLSAHETLDGATRTHQSMASQRAQDRPECWQRDKVEWAHIFDTQTLKIAKHWTPRNGRSRSWI